MREAYRNRLETLEEARKLLDAPVQITHLIFVDAGGSQVESTVARGRDFECFQLAGEGLDAFRARADTECRATSPRGPIVLVFIKENSYAA